MLDRGYTMSDGTKNTIKVIMEGLIAFLGALVGGLF